MITKGPMDLLSKSPHAVTHAFDSFSVAPSLISSFSHASTTVVVKKQEYGRVHVSMQYKVAQRSLSAVVIAAKYAIHL